MSAQGGESGCGGDLWVMSPFQNGNSGGPGPTRGHVYWVIWQLEPTVDCQLPPPIVSRLSAAIGPLRVRAGLVEHGLCSPPIKALATLAPAIDTRRLAFKAGLVHVQMEAAGTVGRTSSHRRPQGLATLTRGFGFASGSTARPPPLRSALAFAASMRLITSRYARAAASRIFVLMPAPR